MGLIKQEEVADQEAQVHQEEMELTGQSEAAAAVALVRLEQELSVGVRAVREQNGLLLVQEAAVVQEAQVILQMSAKREMEVCMAVVQEA